MVVTDPIADFLTRIRNANMVYMDKVEIYFKLNIIEQQELSVVSLPMTAEEDIDTIKREYKSLLK